MEPTAENSGSGNITHRIFISLRILPFILLPLLCLDAGISGDEPVHQQQAEKVYQFYATRGKDTSSIHTPITYLKFYGQSIDNFSYVVNRTLGFDDPYLARHLINSMAGALTITVAGALAAMIAGDLAGILSILFLLLSPVFLGHTYNNLKDIPFALGYVVSIFYLVKFLKIFPVIRYRYLAGIIAGAGFAVSVRIGGLVIFPIILTFAAIQAWFRKPADQKEAQTFAVRLIVSLTFTILLAWLAGIIGWPYGLQNPIKNSILSLQQMTHYLVSLRQLFEGKLIWSENLPWYYAPKYFLLISPLIILAGVPLSWSLLKKQGPVLFSLLCFAAFFPLIWVIIRHSNLYGNIRHLLFIYPILVVLSASGWALLYGRIKKRSLKLALTGLLAFGLAGPLIHIVRNHPVEYVYFNRLSGGMEKAYHRYETDYYFHSLGPAAKWMENNILTQPGADTLIMASNFPLEPFLHKNFPKTPVVFTTWQDQGKYDWDYGLFVNAYLGPGGLEGKVIDPPRIVHRINVDGYPMCYVLQRTDKRDLDGYRYFSDGKFTESAELLKALTAEDPGNETAWLYLGWSLRKMHDPEGSNQAARQLLKLNPQSDPARELLIWNYLDSHRFREALPLAEELNRMNSKYMPGITLLAAVRDSMASLKE